MRDCLRRKGGGTVDLFSRYALGEGAGIFLGSLGGLFAVKSLDMQGIVALSIALMSLVVFVAMATEINPNWVLHGSHAPRGRAPEDPKAASASRAAPEAIFLDEAVDLQKPVRPHRARERTWPPCCSKAAAGRSSATSWWCPSTR